MAGVSESAGINRLEIENERGWPGSVFGVSPLD